MARSIETACLQNTTGFCFVSLGFCPKQGDVLSDVLLVQCGEAIR